MAASASTPAREDAFAAKNRGDYAAATALFAQLLQRQSGDAELWFHYGLVLRFDGRLADALAAQSSARKLAPDDLDIQLEIARLHFYLGDLASAKHLLASVGARAPAYPGVAELQEQLRNADLAPDSALRWWFNLGHEWSRTERGDRWQLNLLQISRAVSADLSLQFHLEHAERYDDADYYAALNGFYRISPSANIAAGVGSGVSEDYLPHRRLWGYGDWRAVQMAKQTTALWLALDLSHNEYSNARVSVAKPGIRLDFADRIEWSLQAILVDSSGTALQNGWATRLGWTINPLRLDAGYSNAPESEESVTLDTRAMFIGARWQISPRMALGLSAAQEKRERGFARDLVNVSFLVRY